MKISNFFILISFFLSFQTIRINSIFCSETPETPIEETKSETEVTSEAGRELRDLSETQTSGEGPKSTKRPFNKKDLIDFFAFILLFPIPASSFIHELGHNLADFILQKQATFNIHLLAKPDTPEAQKHLFQYKGLTLHSFRPWGGGFYDRPYYSENKIKDLLVYMSGPAAGILSLLFFKKLIVDRIKGPENNFAKWYIFNSLKLIISFFFNAQIFDQTRYGFTPFYQNPGGDGYNIWELLGVSKEKLDKLSKFDSKNRIIKSFFLIAMGTKMLMEFYKAAEQKAKQLGIR